MGPLRHSYPREISEDPVSIPLKRTVHEAHYDRVSGLLLGTWGARYDGNHWLASEFGSRIGRGWFTPTVLTELHRLPHPAQVNAVAFARDGKSVATGCSMACVSQ